MGECKLLILHQESSEYLMAWTIESDVMTRTPFLLRIRERVAHEVYQDFQECIINKFGHSTIVLIRHGEAIVTPCFPRNRYSNFCGFCKELRQNTKAPQQLPLCVIYEMEYVQDGIAAEESGKEWQWGWRLCHMGLLDYYIPIRSTVSSNSLGTILGVLIVGHGRPQDDKSLKEIHKRIDAATIGEDWQTYFPSAAEEKRKLHRTDLHRLADQIPIIDEAEMMKIDQEIRETVALMQVMATRTLQGGMLFEGEQFIQRLNLDKVNIDIVEKTLWEEVGEALQQTANYLNLASAVVYASAYSKYSSLERKLTVPTSIKCPHTLALPGYDAFEWLQNNGQLSLPSTHPFFSWLDPTTYFSSNNALIIGREMIGGYLVIIGFGVTSQTRLTPFKEAILYEAVHSKVFPFIMNGMFGIELDHLMAETGHLLGRTRAAIHAGLHSIRRAHPQTGDAKSRLFLEKGLSSIEDGSMNLKLIRANFYSFQGRRQGSGHNTLYEHESGLPPLENGSIVGEHVEDFDAIAVLKDLKGYFDRRVRAASRKPIQFKILCDSAIVCGFDDDLALVFLNLFDNALKFSYRDTYIEIGAMREKNSYAIYFSNLGVGIARDETKIVLEPLRKSRFRDPVRRTEGLGLGLSFCRRVIEDEFQGNIILTSKKALKPRPERAEGDNWLTTVLLELPMSN